MIPKSITKAIEKEFTLLQTNSDKIIAQLKNENDELKNKISVNEKIHSSVLVEIFKNTSIKSILEFAKYQPDFKESLGGFSSNDSAKELFLLIVNYFSLKEIILKLAQEKDIVFPSWFYSFTLPQFWSRDLIKRCAGTLKKWDSYYYSFENNIGDWFDIYKKTSIIEEQIDKEYRIPLQFLWRNPYWNDDEIIDIICSSGNISGSKFHKIFKYQKFSERNTIEIMNKLGKDDFLECFKLQKDHIFTFTNKELINRAIKFDITIDETFPFEYQINSLKKLPFDQAAAKIHRSNLSEQEKAELLKEILELNYSKVAIIDRVTKIK